MLSSIKNKRGEDLIKQYLRQWNNYKILVHWLRRIFDYLDRYYLKHHNMDTLCQTGLKFFKETVSALER